MTTRIVLTLVALQCAACSELVDVDRARVPNENALDSGQVINDRPVFDPNAGRPDASRPTTAGDAGGRGLDGGLEGLDGGLLDAALPEAGLG